MICSIFSKCFTRKCQKKPPFCCSTVLFPTKKPFKDSLKRLRKLLFQCFFLRVETIFVSKKELSEYYEINGSPEKPEKYLIFRMIKEKWFVSFSNKQLFHAVVGNDCVFSCSASGFRSFGLPHFSFNIQHPREDVISLTITVTANQIKIQAEFPLII